METGTSEKLLSCPVYKGRMVLEQVGERERDPPFNNILGMWGSGGYG